MEGDTVFTPYFLGHLLPDECDEKETAAASNSFAVFGEIFPRSPHGWICSALHMGNARDVGINRKRMIARIQPRGHAPSRRFCNDAWEPSEDSNTLASSHEGIPVRPTSPIEVGEYSTYQAQVYRAKTENVHIASTHTSMFSYMPSVLIGALALTSALLAYRVWNYGRRELGLPPGPPTTPILGNIPHFPRLFPFLQFSRWAAEYGDIYSLKVLDRTMVILSSGQAIKDILDKNGTSTSDRFQPYTLLHAEGIYQIFDHASSHRWRAMRKATHTFLAPEALQGHWGVQQIEYTRLLYDIVESPKDIYTHIKRTTASVMTTLIYGKSIPHYAGSKAELFFEGTKCINELAAPFDHPPLDFFPILRHVPERWAPWKTLSKKTKQIRNAFDQDLFHQCEEAVRSGKRTGCYLENVIETQVELGSNRNEVRAMGRVLLDAGTETSASFLHSFIMAMTCHPEVQSKAQAEIDEVLGNDQLPVLEDYGNLPYLNALIKELHRFRPIIPVGVPHVASRETHYNGFVIPQGSVIFMNIWGVFHDPDIYLLNSGRSQERIPKVCVITCLSALVG
ncbi:hypothetical protein PTI98_001611 [Pleurotus ostreatus]|nr:hypothetical protein PTI98_001611 [Pleurotus ostreatus]